MAERWPRPVRTEQSGSGTWARGQSSSPISRRESSRATPGLSSASLSAPMARRSPRPAMTGPSGSGTCGPGRHLAAGFFKGISRRSDAWPSILGRSVLASAGADRTVRLWDASTRSGTAAVRRLWQPRGRHRVQPRRRPDRDCLPRSLGPALGCHDRPTPGGLSRPRRAGLQRRLSASTAKKLASASQDATVKVWDLTSEPGVRLLSLEPEQQSHNPGAIGWVGGLAFRRDGLELATGGTDQALAVWNLTTARANQASPPAGVR